MSGAYWVQDWPRSRTWCTALARLLADGRHRRSFGMIFEPLPPRTAERQVVRERTARDVAALEADAAAARIELRRMWFAQDSGFALACLPLGPGLPRKRW